MKRISIVLSIVIVFTFMTTVFAEILYEPMSKYGYNGACGPFSVINCINSLGLSEVKLENAINEAKLLGWTPSGMSYQQLVELARNLAPDGVQIRMESFSIESFEEIIQSGGTCVICIDSNAFWNESTVKKINHCIAVLGIETDESGNVSFDIVDSGLGYKTMSEKQLENCTYQYICGISFQPKC